jgi:uncharacterized protein involved in exopolysaccharide biosynthesis
VSHSGTRPQIEVEPQHVEDVTEVEGLSPAEVRANAAEHARLLWSKRAFLARTVAIGLVVGLVIAMLIPPRYEATTQLMPPDSQSGMGASMLAALAGRAVGGGGSAAAGASSIGSMAGELLGVKSSGALFIGILGSRTVLDRLVERFDLR